MADKRHNPGTILGADGRPMTAERVRYDRISRFNPCADLTPDGLSGALVAFQRGELKRLAWMAEWMMEHDDMLSPVSAKARSAVSRHGWDVEVMDDLGPGETALAEEQAAALKRFYHSLEAGHAVDSDECGGVRLLVEQVMDAYAMGASAHHLIWRPGREGISVKAVFVPLRFFEATEGRLRFLETDAATYGTELEQLGGRGAWMVARGRGVMKACAIAWMYKHIPLQDWLTYCDRHGMPGFLGKTGAQYGSAGWDSMADAVGAMGSEFGAVVSSGDAIEVLNLTAQGQIPYPAMVDRMDRAMAIMWRGGDLGTLSRGNGVGSDPQGGETDELDADNAEWISETVDRQLSRYVLDWTFGKGTPALARFVLRTASRVDTAREIAAVKELVGMGLRVSQGWAAERFAVPMAAADEADVLRAPGGEVMTLEETVEEPAFSAANAAADLGDDAEGRARLVQGAISKAFGVRAEMLKPVEAEMARLAARAEDGALTDEEFLEMWEVFAGRLPEFFSAEDAGAAAEALEEALGAAAFAGAREGLRSKSEKR